MCVYIYIYIHVGPRGRRAPRRVLRLPRGAPHCSEARSLRSLGGLFECIHIIYSVHAYYNIYIYIYIYIRILYGGSGFASCFEAKQEADCATESARTQTSFKHAACAHAAECFARSFVLACKRTGAQAYTQTRILVLRCRATSADAEWMFQEETDTHTRIPPGLRASRSTSPRRKAIRLRESEQEQEQ